MRGTESGQHCSLMPKWNGYLCDSNIEYHMLQIESMDSDTETRRVSPLSVFSMPLDVDYTEHESVTILHSFPTHFLVLYFNTCTY